MSNPINISTFFQNKQVHLYGDFYSLINNILYNKLYRMIPSVAHHHGLIMIMLENRVEQEIIKMNSLIAMESNGLQ